MPPVRLQLARDPVSAPLPNASRPGSRWVRLAVCLSLTLGSAAALRAQEEAPRRHLSLVQDVWTIPEADKDVPYSLDGEITVLYYDADWKLFWGRFDGPGVYLPLSNKPLPLRSGQRVRMTGEFIASEGLNPDRLRITVLEEQVALSPHPISGDLDALAKENAEYVSLEGYVNASTEVDPRHLRLQLSVHEHLFNVTVQLGEYDPIPDYTGTFVRVEGTLILTRNPGGAITSAEVWAASPRSLTVTHTLSDHPDFQLPVTPIDQLQDMGALVRARVRGVIRSVVPGKSLVLRDDTGQIELLTAQTLDFGPGKIIDAVGDTRINTTQWQLSRGIYRPAEMASGENSEASRLRLDKLRLADQVITLSHDEADRGFKVRLSGVVTWSSPHSETFFLSDASGGVQVRLPPGATPPAPERHLRLTGATASGDYAPMVVASQITVLGSTGLPKADRLSPEQLLTGIEEARWVAINGYVRAVVQDGPWALIDVLTSGGSFQARMDWSHPVTALAGSVVAFEGVCSALADEHRQLTGVQLWVPSLAHATLLEAAPVDPFAVAPRSVASLRRFSTLRQSNRRVHLTGVVTHLIRGRELTLQDETAAVRVFTRDEHGLTPGQSVSVVGFPTREDERLVLREASVRPSPGEGAPLKPAVLDASSAPLQQLDRRLVTVEGRVLDTLSSERETRLSLQRGQQIFQAVLGSSGEVNANALPAAGALVSLTGVYDVNGESEAGHQRFQLHLRSLGDIHLVRAAPWWTTERALAVTAVGGLAALLGFGWVIALRRRVNQQTDQLRRQWESQERLRARHIEIVENASDFIFTTDESGCFTSFNAAGEALTGFNRSEVRRLRLADLIQFDDDTASGALQGRLMTRDGRIIWVETSTRPILEEGRRVGDLGIVRDISKRKQIEDELKRARDTAEATVRSKGAFLANMSHEIRTPMNGVIGISNLLLDTPLSQEQKDFAETIRSSAEALLTVLNDILDFSKIEAGKLRFEVTDFNLREAVDSAVELLAPRASSKQLELISFIPNSVPCRLRGDPGRLRQVLLNLLGNAIKFTESGEVALSISALEETEDGVELAFSIRDTGIGLDAETQSRLFRPFAQADDSTTRKFGGTGLGLVISKQIVEMMDGTIGVESELGRGSTFRFTAKFGRQPRGGTQPAHPLVDRLRGRQVLVVDDHPTNRKILWHHTTAWGMTVREAADGEAALLVMRRCAREGRAVDVVLSDHQMPAMDGLMLRSEMLADPHLAATPFILLTSLERRLAAADSARFRISEVLTKPVRQKEIASALLRSLGTVTPAPASHRTGSGDGALPSASGTPAQPALRILIAEDNPVNQKVTALQLTKLGHRSDVAGDGLEVLEALERTHYDVILMDWQMPEMDGFEATRRIRQNGRHRHIKIVAMTANAMKGDREACLAAGMDDYLSKPTRTEEIEEVLRRVIQEPVLP